MAAARVPAKTTISSDAGHSIVVIPGRHLIEIGTDAEDRRDPKQFFAFCP
jgi:hypothetical protein